MRTEDGYIVHKSLNGDSAAFGFLVDKYKAGVFAFAYERLHNFHDAEDVAQEVFLKAYKSLRCLRRWDSFASWLYRITGNLCRDWVRAQSRRPDHEFIDDQAPGMLEADSKDSYRREQVCESVREALNSLPEMYRHALTLYYLGGMTSVEIGRFVGASPTSIRMRLSKARSLLKEEVLAMANTSFEKQGLQATFTFRIIEAVKRLKIQPIPRLTGLPWGLSVATGIILAVLCLNPHMGISSRMIIRSPSPFPVQAQVLGGRQVLVDILDVSQIPALASKQGVVGRAALLLSESQGATPNAYLSVRDNSTGSDPGNVPGRATDTAYASSGNANSAQAAEKPSIQEPSVSGRITSKIDGKPLAGARVWISKGGKSIASKDGNYRIDARRTGENRLWAAADGFATALMIMTVSSGQQLTGVDIGLVPGVDISGKVVDEKGNPVKGAEVRTSMNHSGMESVKTDVQGEYRYNGLDPSRKYTMVAEHPGLMSGWIEVSAGQPGKLEVPDIVLRHRVGVTVSGRVVNEPGEPVGGAEVFAGRAPYMSNRIKTKTDAEGRYTIENVIEGESFVIVKGKGYGAEMQRVRIGRDKDIQLDFTLKPGKGIAGKVLDADGKPIAGVHIAVGAWYNSRPIHDTTIWAQTDADGHFRFANLPEIKDTVLNAAVMKDGYSRIDGIIITPGSTDMEFVMRSSGKIAGKVVDAHTTKPIPSFTIKLAFPRLDPGEDVLTHGMAASWGDGYSYVSSEGKFLASEFVLGCVYRLTAMAEGYIPTTIERVATSASPKADDLVIELERERMLTGIVTDARTGALVENASVWLFNADYPMIVSPWSNVGRGGTESVRSGTDGSFAIGGGSGENFLYADHPQYAPAVVGPIGIQAGGDLPPVAIRLGEGGKVTGYVKSGTEPVSGGRMDIALTGGIINLEVSEPHRASRGESAFAFQEKAKTSDEGYFEFEHLMPGEYRLTQTISGEGSSSSVRMTDVLVSEGRETSFKFGGGGGAIVRGKVTDGEGAPMNNTAVTIRIDDDPLRSGGADYTDSEGRYEIRDLPPGMHELRAMKLGTRRPGEDYPRPMRFSGTIEVPEGDEEIEHHIRMTAQEVVPARSSKPPRPADFDSSGKKIGLPESTKEQLPVNGNFENDLTGWTKWQGKDDISVHTCEVVYDEEKKSNVVVFKRTNGRRGGSRVGIAQDIYIDLSGHDEIYLLVDVKPIYQSLPGGGWAGGGEYPLTIELAYVDQEGVGYKWRHGLYHKGESRYSDSSTKIPEDAWFTYISPNLKEILPVCADELRVKDGRKWGKEYHEYKPPVIPKVITRILIFGGGWDFVGRADSLQFETSR